MMMKSLIALSLCSLSATAAFAEHHEAAEFQSPVMLHTVDGDPISSDGWTVPYVVDVDGDGKQDLIVGQFMNTDRPWPRFADEYDEITAGTVRFYRNISTGDTPEYAAGVDLQAADGAMSAPNW